MKHSGNILGFAASIEGILHPVAMYKLAGGNAYLWDWHHPSNGHTIVFEMNSLPIHRPVPLSRGKVFSPVTEQHRSYHIDGRRHLSIKASGREAEYLTNYKSTPIREIQDWESLSHVDVPLTGSFCTSMDAAAWREVKNPEVLKSCDFENAYGVGLCGFLCKHKRIDDLIARWGKLATRHWIAGNRSTRLVVFAEALKL